MKWANPSYSFDNVFEGMLCLFEVSSLEGWTDVMYSGMDASGVDNQPVTDYSPVMALFFVIQIFVCAFFILNMVVGVIIEKFNQMSGRGMLTDDQKNFKDLILSLATQQVEAPVPEPENPIRRFFYRLTNNKVFEAIVLFLLVGNCCLMGAEFCGQTKEWEDLQELLNFGFAAVFFVELYFRLVAQGFKIYFSDGWNIFDFVVIHGCVILFFIDDIGIPLQALRPVRLLLVFRMVKKLKGVRLMVATLMASLPAMFNIGSLLFMVLFVYSVIGMQMFSTVKFGDQLSSHNNFRTFGSSMLLLVRCLTGENWNVVMKDCSVQPPDCTPYESTTQWDGTENEGKYWLPADCGQPWVSRLVSTRATY